MATTAQPPLASSSLLNSPGCSGGLEAAAPATPRHCQLKAAAAGACMVGNGQARVRVGLHKWPACPFRCPMSSCTGNGVRARLAWLLAGCAPPPSPARPPNPERAVGGAQLPPCPLPPYPLVLPGPPPPSGRAAPSCSRLKQRGRALCRHADDGFRTGTACATGSRRGHPPLLALAQPGPRNLLHSAAGEECAGDTRNPRGRPGVVAATAHGPCPTPASSRPPPTPHPRLKSSPP